MRRGTVESSFIKTIGYDHGLLEIEFTDGKVFQYEKVPYNVYKEFVQSRSKGTFFNSRIGKKFAHKEI